ncbi:hypothetical protein SAMN05216325_106107 [Nitrosomonas marina]|uniref:Uncharacterized protein n=1 Tax=Nitrosomonas marina TaxID=917 RepID=A0A1H8D8A3_9PROT|nr:hypothetical protein SAMN05216325_106107 [Nitrosomonas marina]
MILYVQLRCMSATEVVVTTNTYLENFPGLVLSWGASSFLSVCVQ